MGYKKDSEYLSEQMEVSMKENERLDYQMDKETRL